MEQIEQICPQSIGYFFLRSKSIHHENELVFVTFFARLTRETSFSKNGKLHTKIQTVWVDIDERKLEHTSPKTRASPNCIERYELSEDVFHSLCQEAKRCPTELFHITPYHRLSTREVFKSNFPCTETEKHFNSSNFIS